MGQLESGLFHPIRFYLNISEQDRYKRHSIGVALTDLNYVYVDCTQLVPFQISFLNDTPALDIKWYIVCAGGGTQVELPYNAAYWGEFINTDGMYFLSYFGYDNLSSYTENGLHYLIVTVTTSSGEMSWYSDLFMIANCGGIPYDTDNFRTWSGSDRTNLRSIDATDLRIFTK